MTLTQVTGSTVRGGLLRGAIAGVVALLVVYGGLLLTSDEPDATATALCGNGTVITNPSANPGLVSDCATLLELKDELRGTGTLNWSADIAMSDWAGLTIAGTPLRVTEIDLDQSGLNGTIPARLGDLRALQELNLSGNALTGSIPEDLASLRELVLLALNDNSLAGALPGALGKLSKLRWLRAYGNVLTGGIPSELGTLWSLEGLYLDGNQLSGTVPAALDDLPRLNELYLEGNSGLSGCIPAELSDVPSHDLDTLGLSYCAASPTHTLTLSSMAGGFTAPFAGVHTYRSGALVRVEARPHSGNRVASWGGDCSGNGTATTCILTMDADKTASVTFEQGTAHTLTTWGGAYGTTEPGPGTHSYHANASVTVTAMPETGYQVASWSGDCSGSGATCTLTMDGDKTAYVTFEEVTTYTLTTSSGANGSIAPAPGTHVYDAGASVTITATPDAGYGVDAWGGDCSTAIGTTEALQPLVPESQVVALPLGAMDIGPPLSHLQCRGPVGDCISRKPRERDQRDLSPSLRSHQSLLSSSQTAVSETSRSNSGGMMRGPLLPAK